MVGSQSTSAKTVFKVFLFTDIVGSTDLKNRLGDAVAADAIGKHDALFRKILKRFSGTEEDDTGDGFFASFDLPSEAVQCGLEFLSGLRSLEFLEPLQVRVGIHAGEIVRLTDTGADSGRDKLIGLAVDTAARVMGLAGGGQVLLTRSAFDSARQQFLSLTDGSSVQWLAHGPYLFKGVEDAMEVFEAGIEGLSPLAPPGDSEKAKRAIALGEEEALGWRPAAGLTIPRRENWTLQEQVGEGGYGEVWLAAHEKTKEKRVFKFCFDLQRVRGLRREVVLFRLLRETLGDRDDIVRILEWQFDKPPYFLESEYTAAGDLIHWTEGKGGVGAIPLATRLELVAQTAVALGAAHSVGVLHKDVKPSNILIKEIAERGEPRASLTDFGIGLITNRDALEAKGITAAGLTQTLMASSSSSQSGTRLYMAPEVLEGKQPTTLCDVYALGVVLYQMVIGDFSRAVAPGWERDVEDEFLREDIAACVDGNPEHRLAGVGELAERLHSLDQRRAQREAERKAQEVAEKHHRHRRQLAIASSLGLILALIAGVVALREYQRAENEGNLRQSAERAQLLERQAREEAELAREQAEQARDEAHAAMAKAEEQSYFTNLLLARRLVEDGQFSLALDSLWSAPRQYRNWEWGYLLKQCSSELLTIAGHENKITAVAYSPDSSAFVTASVDADVKVWDAATGEERHTLTNHSQIVDAVLVTPDSKKILTASYDKTVRVWDLESGAELHVLEGHGRRVLHISASPDGRFALTCSGDKTAKVWDLASGEELHTLSGHEDWVRHGAFSPDGSLIATASDDGTAKLWRREDGNEVTTLEAHTGAVRTVVFHPDGKQLMTASKDGTVIIWDAATAERVLTLEGSGGEMRLARYSPDGRRILGLTTNRRLMVWDNPSGELLYDIEAHKQHVHDARFSPDGTKVITLSDDTTAKVWQADSGRLIAVLAGHGDAVQAAAYSPDGVQLVTVSADRTIRLWQTQVGTYGETLAIDGHHGEVTSVAFSADSKSLLTAGEDGVARLWDIRSGELLLSLAGHSDRVVRAVFSPDETLIATNSFDGTVKLWDVDTGAVVMQFIGHVGPIIGLAFSPDGSEIATGGADQTLRIWDVRTGVEKKAFGGSLSSITDIAFHPDGNRISTGSGSISSLTWDRHTGKIVAKHFAGLGTTGAETAVELTDDGKYLLVASSINMATLIDVDANEDVVTYTGHEGPVITASFSEDERRVVTAEAGRATEWTGAAAGGKTFAIKVWDTDKGRELLSLEGLRAPIYEVAFSPDGLRLAAASADGVAFIWEALPWREDQLPGDNALSWPERLELYRKGIPASDGLSEERVRYLVSITYKEAKEKFESIRELLAGLHEPARGQSTGLLVTKALEEAGFRRFSLFNGDHLQAFDSTNISSAEQAHTALDAFIAVEEQESEALSLKAIVNGKEALIEVRFERVEDTERRPIPLERERAGEVLRGTIRAVSYDGEEPKAEEVLTAVLESGIRISPNSNYPFPEDLRLKPRDFIVKLNDVRITTIRGFLDELEKILELHESGAAYTFSLQIVRNIPIEYRFAVD